MALDRLPGAFVISLDFELHWGVRDHTAPNAPYRANLLGARAAIPRILSLFEEFGIAATWATVGLLFARSTDEMMSYRPAVDPQYDDPRLNPFVEPLGANEADDPIHFASSLIERIRVTPRQEIGTHTYSHYYCLAKGQTADAFDADLASATAIASNMGVRLSSIVFPRNQWNPSYDFILARHGITTYRGNARSWMYSPAADRLVLFRRAARLLDSCVPLGDRTFAWEHVRTNSGLRDVAASLFLRPSTGNALVDHLQTARVAGVIRAAAKRGRIAHIWWHPHNFGSRTDANINMLRRILRVFVECRERYGMRSLTMTESGDLAMLRETRGG